MISKTGLLLLSLLFILFTAGFLAEDAKGQAVHRQVKWGEPVTRNLDGAKAEKVLVFEGGVYGANDIPVYVERFPVASAYAKANAVISGMQFEQLRDGALITDARNIGTDINVKTEIVVERKKAFVQVTFIPIKKNPSGSGFERLVSFDLNVTSQSSGGSRRLAMRYFTPNSVLATGTWYKIGVTNDGIYKLT